MYLNLKYYVVRRLTVYSIPVSQPGIGVVIAVYLHK